MSNLFPRMYLADISFNILLLAASFLLLFGVYAYLLGAMDGLRRYDGMFFTFPFSLVRGGYIVGLILIIICVLTLVLLPVAFNGFWLYVALYW